MSTKDMLKGFCSGYLQFTRQRADAVRQAVYDEGVERGIDPFRVAEACQEAEKQFMRDPTSGHRAIEWGRLILSRPNNVIPMRRRRQPVRVDGN